MMKTMNKERMGWLSQGMEREQYLASLAKVEIQHAIESVVKGEASELAECPQRTGYPDMAKCWKCGSTHLSMIENKFQDRAMVWCLDCGKTWLERCFR
jgi:hypothetical protein